MKKHIIRLVIALFLSLTMHKVVHASAPPVPKMQGSTDHITQYEITWTFDQAYEYGQFANGDYWVVGPVTIVAIDPPSTQVGDRIMNGSMINPDPALGNQEGYEYGDQGYDSYAYSLNPESQHYKPELNVAFGVSAASSLVVPVGSSLVSTISLEETDGCTVLDTAAILTVLAEAPAEGSFRPPYAGTDKTIHWNTSQLNYTRLARLSPVEETPQLADIERNFERPWIDHVPNFLSRCLHPVNNMEEYGANIARVVGDGALMLNLDFSNAEKETLLIRYVQLGIDLYGIVENGYVENGYVANYVPNGGHMAGRKWPTLFAGVMLGDDAMVEITRDPKVLYQEDAQTFYVTQETVDYPDYSPNQCGMSGENLPCGGYTAEDIGIAEWGIIHAVTPRRDCRLWDTMYRQCCTAKYWAGFILSAYAMGQKSTWDHDVLFDYMDRYMDVAQEVGHRQQSPFAENMWDAYRSNYDQLSPTLTLSGTPADRAIHLTWEVSGTLPATSTWQITYTSDTGTAYLPITGIVSPTRAFTLTELTNGVWYSVTLSAMLDSSTLLSDTVRVMPFDPATMSHRVYLPLVLRSPTP